MKAKLLPVIAAALALSAMASAQTSRVKVVTRPNDLIKAVEAGDTEAAKAALEQGLSPTRSRDAYGKTALDLAALSGNLEMMKLLVEYTDKFDKSNRFGTTPLNYACFAGHLDIARYLLEQDADPNSENKRGFTPLMEAARRGRLELVKLLVEHGARVHTRDKEGQTAAALARGIGKASAQCKPIVDFLGSSGR